MSSSAETGWLVIGANGQLGKALQSLLAMRDDVTFWGRDEADLVNPLALKNALSHIQPSAVINAAAYTAVDKAEEEPEKAAAINADSVGIMADFCAARGIPLVHYSTDYVFNGQGDQPWRETDEATPINAYGLSKRNGEKAIISSGCDYLIFRTSWVYDAQGQNFLNTMLRLGAKMEKLTIVADQMGAPTYAPHLAEVTMNAFNKALALEAFPSGIYHASGGADAVSWYDFALAIFEHAKNQGIDLAVKSVEPIPSSAYPTPAKRPLNSRLNMQKLQDVFALSMPAWRDGLAEAMRLKASLTR